MKAIFGLVLLAALYYAHGLYMFGETHLNAWFAENNEAVLNGKENACDDFSPDVQFNITQKTAEGDLLMEGGYNKLCDLTRLSAEGAKGFEQLKSLGMPGVNMNTYTRVTSVDMSAFPWLQATVKAHQATRITMGTNPPMVDEGDFTLLVERTYEGLKIKRLTGSSEMRIIEDPVEEPVEGAEQASAEATTPK